MKFILGKKLGMSQVFTDDGKVVPVTVIEAGPCVVLQIKTKDSSKSSSEKRGKKPRTRTPNKSKPRTTTSCIRGKFYTGQASSVRGMDGYDAVQVGFEKLKDRKIKKTQKKKPFRYLREFRGDVLKYKEGDKIDVSVFEEGETVKVSGTSKGKGFQGVVKRWGFHGAPASHGTKHNLRAPGSIGSSFPEKVFKGLKMAGRMGGERVSVKNLKVVKVDPENNLIAVSGAVPGNRGSLVEIRSVE